MLLVDFGERSYKFAVCKKVGQNMEVGAWGVEDMRSLEHGTKSILEKAGESSETDPVFLSFSPSVWRAKTFYERIERKDAALRIVSAEKEEIVENLSQRVRKKLEDQMQSASGILAKDVVIEKQRIYRCAIDGYDVPDILGFSGKHLDFQLLCIFTLAQYRPILNAISQRFKNPSVFHLAEALGGFSRTKKQDGLYLDMGDDYTQVVVVKEQQVLFVDQVPRAGKDFTRFLQETLALGENTAKDFKERYAAGDFSFLLRERVKEGFLNLGKELLGLVRENLRKAAVSLPPSIRIFGGTSKLPELQEIFQGKPLCDLPFSQEPAASSFLPKDLWSFSQFSGKTNPILTPLFLLPYADKENS